MSQGQGVNSKTYLKPLSTKKSPEGLVSLEEVK